MLVNELRFPVICFWRTLTRVRDNYEQLTTTTSAGVANGMFNNLLVVDSDGLSITVKKAEKLHGIGFLWGYNIFLDQSIKVVLFTDGSTHPITLDEIKNRIGRCFKSWHGWQTRGDFSELTNNVLNATSIPEIISIMRE